MARITNDMIQNASDAYAQKRHPARWEGEPWGEAGRRNHKAGIKAALATIFKDYKLVKK